MCRHWIQLIFHLPQPAVTALLMSMNHSLIIPLLSVMALAFGSGCAAANDGNPISSVSSNALATGVCPESVTLDARGDYRNAAGQIRNCFPGEARCRCDANNDCWRLPRYVACTPLVAPTTTTTGTSTALLSSDAGVADTGVQDGGTADAGTADAGTADAGTAVTASPTRPTTASSWHIDLEVPVDTTVAADWYDIDLFDNGASVVRAIHARGSRVVCYFSAGSGENWRPDYASIPSAALGSALDGWAGERWLDIRATGVRDVMRARMDRAVAMGCDGVDPDNVDGYSNANGFGFTASDQLAFNRFLASEAHARGMIIGLKNDVDQVASLVTVFDFAVNESCFAYSECDREAPFTLAGRAVLNIEYGNISSLRTSVCPRALTLGFYSILSSVDRLDGTYTRCR